MVAEMPPGMLERWMAYEAWEPFGELRSDWRFGQLCALVKNLFDSHHGREGDSQPKDWFFRSSLEDPEEDEDQTLNEDDVWAVLSMWAAENNAKFASTSS